MSEGLTAREFQVALLVAEGFTDKAIAGKLMVKLTTVKFHVRRIAKKLGYHGEPDRNQRVRVARDPRCHVALHQSTGELVAKGS